MEISVRTAVEQEQVDQQQSHETHHQREQGSERRVN
jgi:hypothetical protein